GSKIAFAHYGTEFSLRNNHDIYIMDSDGSNQTRLASTLSPGQTESTDYHPSWSPDGSKIFFSSRRDDNYEIYSMNADGSDQTRITDTSLIHESRPSVSPDGAKIVYHTGGASQIWVIDIDGGNPNQLTLTSDTKDINPSWNHDGSLIVFSSFRGGVRSIYTMDADGNNLSRVTGSPNAADWPVWSPDGKKIIYQHTENSNTDIRIIGADGSGDTRLTVDPGSDRQPSTWRTILSVAEDLDISPETPVFLRSNGTRGSDDGQFRNPRGVAVTSDGSVYYVGDTNNHRIQKFDEYGRFLGKWGDFGSGESKFSQLHGVAV
ncbi:uncharacterized protein METZ01_LOCUS352972, partial [marine metagenome]